MGGYYMAYRESRVALVLCKNCTVKFPIDKLTVYKIRKIKSISVNLVRFLFPLIKTHLPFD